MDLSDDNEQMMQDNGRRDSNGIIRGGRRMGRARRKEGVREEEGRGLGLGRKWELGEKGCRRR